MINSTLFPTALPSAGHQEWLATWQWRIWFALIMAGSVALSALLISRRADPVLLVWMLFLLGATLILREPRHGIYLMLFLALAGDSALLPAYPFVKGLSSRESLMYVGDAFIISPIEIYLALTILSWMARAAIARKISFFRGPLWRPVLLFTLFIILGLLYGASKGGDLNVALWEARSILYLPLMMGLATNLLKRREHLDTLWWAVAGGLFVEGLVGVWYVSSQLNGDLSGTAAITQHSAAVHMNLFFIFLGAVWIYGGSSSKRFILPVLVLPIVFTYVATQRRAAFVGLGVGVLLLLVMLFWENRAAFWLIAPALVIGTFLYTAAFWNVDSAIGMPAQAIKTIVAPTQLSAADRSSNYYRYLENVNVSYTIHSSPLLGVGFGNPFHRIVAMPNISWFVWWEYMTHNSILWIWIKTGVGGFLALLFMIGRSLVTGSRLIWQLPNGTMRVTALAATLYILMHFLYAYVDFSWEAQSMLLLGAMMGMLNRLETMASSTPSSPSLLYGNERRHDA